MVLSPAAAEVGAVRLQQGLQRGDVHLAGGAVGNIFDRVRFGMVTDFIVWQVTTSSGVHQWPTFNVADAALVIGVASILLDWPRDRLDNHDESELPENAVKQPASP